MKKGLIVLVLIMGIFSAFLFMGNKNEAKINVVDQKSVKYNDTSERQVLDIYYPKKVKNTGNPSVIFLHGGSYISGSKEGGLAVNKELFTKNGYVYIPINYRLSEEKVFPGALDDVKSAIRFLKANSKQYNLDPNNIYVIGHSAGANLGSMVATTDGVEAFGNEKINNIEYRSDIAGFIGIAGFYDLNVFFEYMKLNGKKEVYENIIKYYGKSSYDKLKPFITENNSNYLKNMKTPVFVQHGQKDRVVPYNETQKYCTDLKFANKNINLRCEFIQNFDHKLNSFMSGSNSNKIIEWLDEQVNR